MNLRILACIALFAVAMLGVKAAATGIVSHFGIIASLAVIAAMYGAARLYDQRERL